MALGGVGAARRAVMRSFTDTFTHKRPGAASPDATGGWTETYATLGTVVGRLVSRSPAAAERLSGGQLRMETLFTLYLPAGTVVQARDRFEKSGVVLEVIDSDVPRSDGVCVKCAVATVR